MGLFSFLKGSGKDDLAKKEAEAAKQAVEAANKAAQDAVLHSQKVLSLESIVNNLGLGVEGLDIKLDGETVTVFGTVDNQAEKEKIILALGNVNGVAVVDDQMVTNNEGVEADFYVVKSGDSLSKIAKAVYGDAMKYPQIFEANKPMLSDPDKIYPGQTLRIPKL